MVIKLPKGFLFGFSTAVFLPRDRLPGGLNTRATGSSGFMILKTFSQGP